MKKDRQDRILSLIKEEDIETQEELARALNIEGYHVTQATVSRDIKSLQLGKVQKNGKMVYQIFRKEREKKDVEKLVQIMQAGIVSLKTAGNILVIHTISGMANGVAMAIDHYPFPEIVGSLAGDDTLFCAMESPESVERLRFALKGILEKGEEHA